MARRAWALPEVSRCSSRPVFRRNQKSMEKSKASGKPPGRPGRPLRTRRTPKNQLKIDFFAPRNALKVDFLSIFVRKAVFDAFSTIFHEIITKNQLAVGDHPLLV